MIQYEGDSNKQIGKNMSNLGKYQEFTTAAKAAGGVDALLRSMRRISFLKGFGLGAVIAGTGLVIASEMEYRRIQREFKAEIEKALSDAE